MEKNVLNTSLNPKSGLELINLVENNHLRNTTKVKTGDVIRLNYKVQEGAKERTQKIEGIVIAKKHGGINQTITIRRFIGKFGLEQVLPIHSPKISKLQIIQHSKVRRAKLYYLRKATGKAARLKRKF